MLFRSVTRDGELVARHENELSRSTDVAAHPEFAGRRRTQEVDGEELTGWFTEDFTLAELRTLRAVERTPGMRPLNTAYDGRYGVLTLAEVVEITQRRSTPERPVRVQAELKYPAWFAAQGLPMAELVAAELRRLDGARPDGPVVVMAFEQSALRALRPSAGARRPPARPSAAPGPRTRTGSSARPAPAPRGRRWSGCGPPPRPRRR